MVRISFGHQIFFSERRIEIQIHECLSDFSFKIQKFKWRPFSFSCSEREERNLKMVWFTFSIFHITKNKTQSKMPLEPCSYLILDVAKQGPSSTEFISRILTVPKNTEEYIFKMTMMIFHMVIVRVPWNRIFYWKFQQTS